MHQEIREVDAHRGHNLARLGVGLNEGQYRLTIVLGDVLGIVP